MFINCPFCKALVATNPATDQPPEHCPRCAAKLRGVTADTPVPAVATAPHDGPADVPALDPDFLLQVPATAYVGDIAPTYRAAWKAPDESLNQGLGTAAPSELSSQIRQTVALENSTPASPDQAAIAPIAAMLKPADPVPASATTPDAAGRDEGAAVPTGPEPAADAAPPGAAPPATAPVAVQADAGDAQTPAQAGQAAVTDTPPADVPDASADVATEAAASAPSDVEAAPDAADAQPAASEPGAAEVDATTTTADAPAGTAAPTQPAPRALPSFARRRAALGATGLHWKSAAAIAALALLLALQLLLADRDRLAGDARWRPLLANVCGVLGCALPPWHEPEAFALLARDVRPHPSQPDVLRVTATFRNDARWPQPWPRVRLTLSDINGNAVATRDFDAHDYLGNAPTQAELRSGQSASIAMDIVEAGPRSVAFDFDLL